MLSFAQTMCQLKSNPVKIAGDPKNSKSTPYAGYLLDVSNDGKTFSTKSPMYLVYDSKCMNCSVTGTCIQKVIEYFFSILAHFTSYQKVPNVHISICVVENYLNNYS